MADRRYSKAVAVITAIWLLAFAAIITLATADTNVAQAGCRGGSSSGSPSASSSSGGGGGGLPTNVTTILPLPGQSSTGGGSSPSGSASGSSRPSGSGSASGSSSEAPPDKEIPIPTAQAISCKSTITIAYKQNRFQGKVGSGENLCKDARRVTIKRVKRGTDPTVGRGVTNPKGAYKIPEPNANGKYYAQVAQSAVENENGQTVRCQRARSKAINV